ncbi:MAG: hypothetical protein HGA39_07240 [Coriobacteriia bacterium]|nr:hypothetical protein [Coriobacteriia bacterium]
MDSRLNSDLAPCMIGSGTLAGPRDMLRALETLDNLEYRFVVHGETVNEGRAALVKLLADPESATLVVNGCLFLNVMSFRFVDFEQLADTPERWRFMLHGDSSTLELISFPDTDDETGATNRPHLLSEETMPSFESLIALDDDEDDD